jgi:hypothetical protein
MSSELVAIVALAGLPVYAVAAALMSPAAMVRARKRLRFAALGVVLLIALFMIFLTSL